MKSDGAIPELITAFQNQHHHVATADTQALSKETARQLRLRNLSGIIIVDFVDMEDPEDEQRLLETMREQLKYDPMKAAAVDITSLGLMEVTRKKQRKTLKEQAKECGIL